MSWAPVTPHTFAALDDLGVASNLNTWVTSPITNLNTAVGSWTTYAPTITASTTAPTNYTVTAGNAYCVVGNMVFFQYRIDTAAGWTVGSGTYFISLPVTADTTYSVGAGNSRLRISGGLVPAIPLINNSTSIRLDYLTAVTGGMTSWSSTSATPVSITGAAQGLFIYAAA